MARKYRQGRLGEEIKKIIGELLVNGIKDPVLSGRIITVSGVDVTSDGSYATCYVTPLVLEGEDAKAVNKEVLDAFNRASGIFRKKISTDIKLRHTPELIFKIDTSMEYGRHIESILETIPLDEYSDDEPETDEK